VGCGKTWLFSAIGFTLGCILSDFEKGAVILNAVKDLDAGCREMKNCLAFLGLCGSESTRNGKEWSIILATSVEILHCVQDDSAFFLNQ